jgi:hypothetical protein
MLTGTENEKSKEQKREEKLQRDIEKFKANIAIPRPGTGVSATDLPVLEKHGIELSDILYLTLADLRDNPLNEYPPLPDDELAELTEDIRQKGILIALIVKQDGTIVCGHNRKRAGIAAGIVRGPAQQILSELTPELERDIMKSENDRRRGGQWSKEQKEKFIREKFGAELATDNRGGDRKSDQKFNEPLINDAANLARKIEKQSRGRITAGTAKRIVADLRKKAPKKPDSGTASLPAKERRRAEKLAARLETLRGVIVVLEKKLANARGEEKDVLRELKRIG